MKISDIHIGGLVLLTLSTVASVPLTKDNKLRRETREADSSLKEQLQKLRQILKDANGKKEQTTLPTTTAHESVDDIFNKIVDDLKHGDKAGVLLLANALKKLRREHEPENQDKTYGDGIGDYLRTNGNEQPKHHTMSSDEILDILRKLYNKEREKSLKEHQQTTLPTTTVVSEDDTELRVDVLHAIEKRLLRDIGIAVNYGFTPQEIIKDLQKQASKRILPRSINMNHIEKDLKALKSATKVYIEDK